MQRLFKQFFLNSWWLLLFALFCFLAYEHGLRKHKADYARLLQQKQLLVKLRETALENERKLLAEMNSQSDPAWIEMKLMQRLGLSPEGQTKVFFEH